MANYKEIVTKAVVGKAKKANSLHLSLTPDENINTVLGCWVINHNFQGMNQGGKVGVDGAFDVNVWYSYDNDTKTKVNTKRYSYHELYQVPLKENQALTSSSEIMVRSLKQPTVTNVDINNGSIILDVEKELGVEIVGDTKIKVPVEDMEDDYEEMIDDADEVQMDEIKEDYLESPTEEA